MNKKTGFVFSEWFLWYQLPPAAVSAPAIGLIQPGEHCESPESKRRLRNILETSGLLQRLTQLQPRPATDEELARFHDADYLRLTKELSANGGGETGEETYLPAGAEAIARLSAGGVITAAEAVLHGTVCNAYALSRPPGHHAESNRGRGFCIYANVALGVMQLRAAHGVGRVAVVDWDVHHGNGTQSAFYGSCEVLTISLHQDGSYPLETGAASEIGEGKGEGFNINIPLPAGSGHGAYLAAMEKAVLPALHNFKPEMIFVACGFDACALDPLGRMLLYSDSFRAMTKMMTKAADELCGGRLVLCHEGGYSPGYVPFCGLATIEELSGTKPGAEDPFAYLADLPGQELLPHQNAVIEVAAIAAEKVK